jgi:hypothetical protein
VELWNHAHCPLSETFCTLPVAMAASSIVSPVMNDQTRGEITHPNFGETSKAKNEEETAIMQEIMKGINMNL